MSNLPGLSHAVFLEPIEHLLAKRRSLKVGVEHTITIPASPIRYTLLVSRYTPTLFGLTIHKTHIVISLVGRETVTDAPLTFSDTLYLWRPADWSNLVPVAIQRNLTGRVLCTLTKDTMQEPVPLNHVQLLNAIYECEREWLPLLKSLWPRRRSLTVTCSPQPLPRGLCPRVPPASIPQKEALEDLTFLEPPEPEPNPDNLAMCSTPD